MSSLAIRALIKNDLRLYMTDRRAMIIGILVPILIAAFFGYVFGGNGRTDAGRISIAVVDEDDSAVSRAIARDLAAEPLLETRALDRPRAEALVRAGSLQVAAVMPRHFGAATAQALIGKGPKPRVDILIDPTQSLTGRVVEGLIAQYGMRESTKQAFGGSADAPAALRQGLSIPFEVQAVRITSAQNIPYNGYAHSFAGMTTQFILLAGIDAGIALLMMRDRGIWQRLRSAPLGKAQFLFARAASTALISLLQFAVIYGAAIAVFHVRIGGSLPGFLAIAMALCVLNAAFGLMLASIGRSVAATRGIAALVTLLLVMIGGAWVPSFVFPRWLQQASLAAPTRWAVDGLDAMTWRGAGFDAAVAPLAVLIATASVCLAIAIWRFRWD